MTASDDQLVCGARGGDAAAFAALVERHYDRIYRIGYRVLGRRAEAEDLAQDICAALPRKLAAYRGDARFTTWLHSVVVNGARDRLRRQTTQARAADGWAEIQALRGAAAADLADDRAWLTAALRSLDPALRETVALVLGEDMNHAEAARALGISEGTVSWRLSEVRKRLRALAEEERI
ncbi:MAG: RNA polymerase sigma factor [Pseudomonadota bacterium]